MKKPIADLVNSYINKLSEEDLLFLHNRLRDRLADDLAEAIKFMEKTPEMNRWFATSRSANDLYDMVDQVQKYISRDYRLQSLVR